MITEFVKLIEVGKPKKNSSFHTSNTPGASLHIEASLTRYDKVNIIAIKIIKLLMDMVSYFSSLS